MQIKLTTWNINSVRLRIDMVAKFIKAVRPDILCLQETKCPDDAFPRKRFKRLGYDHVALNGQKGYHGVAVLSRLPFESFNIQIFCGKKDCRHISAVFGERAGLRDPITVHNFYVPAGGDIPDPAANPKFAHKLAFLDEMRDCALLRPAPSERAILLGDLNVAPLEHDVWSHKQMLRVVSHTPIECEKFAGALGPPTTCRSRRRWTCSELRARAGAARQRRANILDFAGPLVGARYDEFAHPDGGVRIALEHFYEHGAREAHDRGVFAGDRGGRPLGFREQRGFAKQRSWLGNDLGVARDQRAQPEGTVLDDIGAVGGLARGEQQLAGLDRIAFSADGKNAQRAGAQPMQNGHSFKERDVVLDGHCRSWRSAITAQVCSRRLR
jgi:exodeoxyribonuclease-3